MEFNTVGDLRKYFENVEWRLEQGTLIPTSPEGENDRDRLLVAVTELARLIVEEHHKMKGGDMEAASFLLELIDIRTKLGVLLGKFEGFRHGIAYVVAKAGVYSHYLT